MTDNRFDRIGADTLILQSETYTPVNSAEVAAEYQINYNPSVHGYSGPVQVSYPKYIYPQSGKSKIELMNAFELMPPSELLSGSQLPRCSNRV